MDPLFLEDPAKKARDSRIVLSKRTIETVISLCKTLVLVL
jgi:hypothetical protein